MDVISVEEAAEQCGVSVKAILDAIKEGLLTAYSIDGDYKIRENDLEVAVHHGVFD